jgi:hypothetical protein
MTKQKMPEEVHLFIDTSAFLRFYAFANDDLEELKKVVALIKAGSLKLYVPAQVYEEFQRNREAKLSASLDAFSKNNVSKSLPRFMANYEEAIAFQDAVKALEQARSALIYRARQDASQATLAADIAVAEIVEAAGVVSVTATILSVANMRRLKGNPPGKKDSLGDQINWETLLSTVPEGCTLHVVADDGDYKSPLDEKLPHQFLSQEWASVKKAEIFVHKELRPFLNEKFPSIKFAVDVEKRSALDSLIYSGSFYDTHSAIAAISVFKDDLLWEEVKEIFDAGLSNNQIGWIGTDEDVNSFYRNLIEKFQDNLDFTMIIDLDEQFPSVEESDGK